MSAAIRISNSRFDERLEPETVPAGNTGFQALSPLVEYSEIGAFRRNGRADR
jgi:hypothetical protein